MVTSARVVPTSTAASPLAPLPLEASVPLLSDQQGRLLVNAAATATPAPYTTAVNALDVDGARTVVIGAGTLYRATLSVYAGAGFVQLWDTAGAPGTGTLLCSPIPIPTTLPAYIDVEFNTINGLPFAAGVVVAVSTTAPAYTAPGLGVASGTLTTSYTV